MKQRFERFVKLQGRHKFGMVNSIDTHLWLSNFLLIQILNVNTSLFINRINQPKSEYKIYIVAMFKPYPMSKEAVYSG